jgi:hypothetical protein
MGQEASSVRKDFYAFLCDELKVKITPEQHKKIKGYLVSHANAQAEDLIKEIENLKGAIQNLKQRNELRGNNKKFKGGNGGGQS